MADILIIDDDELVRELLADKSRLLGHRPAAAGSLADGLKMAEAVAPALVFLDVRLPDGDGLSAIPRLRGMAAAPEVIIITGMAEPEGAAMAINSGAWDYLQKPFSTQEISLQIRRALDFRRRKAAGRTPVALKRDGIIGAGPAMDECLDLVAQVAATEVPVFIFGETGTGKELFARVIHENSGRTGAFVVVDCAALPEPLVESILFGHERGAFTGADRRHAGLIAQADGGTLFLDEVGELPLEIQRSFLRVLQERRYRPVGAVQERASRFRLLSATNRNLEAMAAEGVFRQDLLFRLRAVTLQPPPLRHRPHDIKALTLHYLHQVCERHDVKPKAASPELIEALTAHQWPGNVRELIHTLEKAALSDPDSPTLYPFHLPNAIRIHHIQSAMGSGGPEQDPGRAAAEARLAFDRYLRGRGPHLPPLKDFREQIIQEAERAYLIRLMAAARNDLAQACRVSGMSRPRIYALLKKHGISTRAV